MWFCTATMASSGNPTQGVQAQCQRYHCQPRQLNCCLVLGARHSQGSKAECPAKLIFSLGCKVLGSWGCCRLCHSIHLILVIIINHKRILIIIKGMDAVSAESAANNVIKGADTVYKGGHLV